MVAGSIGSTGPCRLLGCLGLPAFHHYRMKLLVYGHIACQAHGKTGQNTTEILYMPTLKPTEK